MITFEILCVYTKEIANKIKLRFENGAQQELLKKLPTCTVAEKSNDHFIKQHQK